MNHLLLPKNPNHSHLQVPLFASDPCSSIGNFLTYPDREGLRFLLNLTTIAPDFSVAGGFGGLLQKWLFFGLIEAVSGFVVRPGEFTRPGVGTVGTVVSTNALYARAEILLFVLRQVGSVRAAKHYAYAKRCLLEADHALRMIGMHDRNATMDGRLLVSFAAVGEFWDAVLTRAFFEHGFSGDTVVSLTWVSGTPNGHVLASQMLQDGWCPKLVAKKAKLNVSALYFLSRLERPNKETKSHRECTSLECRYDRVDERNYETRHVRPGCTCSHFVIKQETLCEVLQQGVTPVLRMESTDTMGSAATVVAAAEGLNYVAFSHVWSDGLGNPLANSLPRCQLLNLCDLATSVLGEQSQNGPVLFWIDTLCCPVKPPEMRNVAIGRMRDTYSGAAHVVVLDSWLRSTLVPTDPDVNDLAELYIRVVSSQWYSRLWTLQEGALAQTLWVKFANYMLELTEEDMWDFQCFRLAPAWAVRMSAASQLLELKGQSWLRNPVGGLLAGHEHDLSSRYVLNGIRGRVTTRASDEAICAATLLGLDALAIVQIKAGTEQEQHEKRMIKLWSLLGKIPLTLLFHPSRGRSLKQNGYRWAPASLLGGFNIDPPPTVQQSQAVASLYEPDPKRGITFQSPGLLLGSCPLQPFHNQFHVRDQSGQWYTAIDCSLVANQQKAPIAPPASTQTTPLSHRPDRLNPWLPAEVSWDDWTPLICPLPVSLALITLHPLDGPAQDHPGSFFNWAIFAAVEKVTKTAIFARSRFKMYLNPVRDADRVRQFEIMCTESRRLERERDIPFGVEGARPAAVRLVTDAKALPVEQTWVLD